MQAFIVNLKEHEDRRIYVSSVLSPYSCLDVTFVSAVDGRKLTNRQMNLAFNSDKFIEEYNRSAFPGEIGCTLSHQNIYHKIVKDNIKSAIIFEDDIVIKGNIEELIPKIEKWLNTETPIIILLSGWFWYTKTDKFDKTHKIAKIVDGYLTHAYAINNAAAKLMLCDRPHLLADAWEKYAKQGIKIYGITPHIVDQDWSNFKSSISNKTIRGCKSKSFFQWLTIKRRTIMQRILKFLGHFEPKTIII